jgi:hypothetical protein
MKTRRTLLLALGGLLVTPASMLATDVTGTCRTGLPGRQNNTRPFTFELGQASDGTLSGTVVGFRSRGQVPNSEIAGDKIRFSAENKYEARSVLMTFQGACEGDQMNLAVTFADNDSKIEITATRD